MKQSDLWHKGQWTKIRTCDASNVTMYLLSDPSALTIMKPFHGRRRPPQGLPSTQRRKSAPSRITPEYSLPHPVDSPVELSSDITSNISLYIGYPMQYLLYVSMPITPRFLIDTSECLTVNIPKNWLLVLRLHKCYNCTVIPFNL